MHLARWTARKAGTLNPLDSRYRSTPCWWYLSESLRKIAMDWEDLADPGDGNRACVRAAPSDDSVRFALPHDPRRARASCGVGFARSIHLFCDMIHHLFTGIIFVWVPLGHVSIEELQNVIDLLSLTLSGAYKSSFAQTVGFLHEPLNT